MWVSQVVPFVPLLLLIHGGLKEYRIVVRFRNKIVRCFSRRLENGSGPLLKGVRGFGCRGRGVRGPGDNAEEKWDDGEERKDEM